MTALEYQVLELHHELSRLPERAHRLALVVDDIRSERRSRRPLLVAICVAMLVAIPGAAFSDELRDLVGLNDKPERAAQARHEMSIFGTETRTTIAASVLDSYERGLVHDGSVVGGEAIVRESVRHAIGDARLGIDVYAVQRVNGEVCQLVVDHGDVHGTCLGSHFYEDGVSLEIRKRGDWDTSPFTLLGFVADDVRAIDVVLKNGDASAARVDGNGWIWTAADPDATPSALAIAYADGTRRTVPVEGLWPPE